jgi:CMP-N-acetylneuraminic acid synthetase
MLKFDNVYFIIPARKGSKGLPFKNRKLFSKTADVIPPDLRSNVIVSTDDDEIKEKSQKYGFQIHNRDSISSNDYASIHDVVKKVINDFKLEDKIIVLLYLTYPERSFEDIKLALEFLNTQSAYSLLCKKKVLTHPYLCFLEQDDNKGKLLIKHPFYRRQDYPKCFEVSHFISIFLSNEVDKLCSQLYNDDTVFFQIEDVIDIDEQKDLRNYENKNHSRNWN